MSSAVSLWDVIQEIEAQSDETVGYLNRVTGECFTITRDEMGMAEEAAEDEDFSDCPDWQQEALLLAKQILETNDYVRLPTKHDIHEWRIMQDFCYTVTNDRQRDRLLDAIHGRGAFRHFRNLVEDYDMRDEWFIFRDAAFGKFAAGWLDEKGIAYIDDVARRRD